MIGLTVTDSQKKALTIATVIAIVGGALFLEPYFTLIAFAGIVAFMFNPIYHRLNDRWKNPNRSSTATLLIALLILLIPLIGVLALSVRQIDTLADSFDSSTLGNIIAGTINGVNDILTRIGLSFRLDQASATENIQGPLKEFGQNSLKSLPGLFSGFFNFFSTAIIFLFVFLSILKNQRVLVRTAHALNPLGEQISRLYLSKTAAMTKAMVRGQFIIAILQGLVDAALLAMAGLPEYFFFFFVLLSALSVIPLGGGIVAIPIGIVMILTGHIWEGILVIAGHIIIVTNIDNVLRPRLVPKEAKLDSALTLLSVFAGLKLFGFLGIVLGPVIMILIVTTIQVYLEVHGFDPKDGKPHRSRGMVARSIRRLKKLLVRPS